MVSKFSDDYKKHVDVVYDMRSETQILADTTRGFRVDTIIAEYNPNTDVVTDVEYANSALTLFEKDELDLMKPQLGDYIAMSYVELIIRMSILGFRLSDVVRVPEKDSMIIFQRNMIETNELKQASY